MTPCRAGAVLHQIHRLIERDDPENLSDRELLECFILRRDEAAFATLLHRHGPMVMRVCRRVLHDWHAAEDAFQATFLVLARKAASVRRREGVGGWLHGVAYRLALKALRQARRRSPDPTAAAAAPDPLDQLTLREAQTVLDEELHKLPAKYREPLLLCYLEEKTRDEAARQLKWPLGTLKSRVERGRDLLRVGLERRGLTLSAVLTAVTLAPRNAEAALSADALRQTARAVLRCAAGPASSAAGLSPEALALARGAFPMFTSSSLRWMAVALVTLALVGPGLGLVLCGTPGAPPAAPPANEPPPATARRPTQDLHGDPLPPDSLARLGTVRWRQEDEVAFLGYLANGRHLVTRGLNGRFHVWDRHTGQVVREFGNKHEPEKDRKGSSAKSGGMMARGMAEPAEQMHWTSAAALAPDGQTLAAAEPDGNVILWDVATGKERRHWKAGGGRGLLQMVADLGTNHLTMLVFSPDGKRLATRNGDGTLQVWDVADGREVRKLRSGGLLGGVNEALNVGFKKALAFSPDGKELTLLEPGLDLTGKAALSLKVNRWDVTTGKDLSSPGKFTDVPLFGTMSPDGKTLAVATAQKEVILWDLAGWREVRRITLGGELLEFASQLTFSPDGKLLAIKAGSQPIGVWDVAEGKELRRLGEVRQEGVVAGMLHSGIGLALGRLVFSPDGRRLAQTEGGRTIRQWDVTSGQEVDHFAGHGGPVEAVALTADGRRVCTEAENTVIQWDAAGGKVIRQTRVPNVTHVAVSADGRRLLLGSTDGMLAVRDVWTGEETHRWKAHAPTDFAGGVVSIPPLLGIALAPDGKRAASWGSDQTIRVWDVATGHKLRELPAKIAGADNLPGEFIGLIAAAVAAVEPANRLIFSADGTRLAVLPSQIPGIAQMGEMLQRQLGNQPAKRAAAAEPPAIGMWDLTTGRPARRFDPAPEGLLTGTFAPDGRTVATGHADGEVILWETATGKPRLRLQTESRRAVRVLRYTADSRTLIGGCGDGVIRVWDLVRGEEVRRLTGHRGAVLSLALSADGKTLVSGSQDTTALVWPMPARVSDRPSQATAAKAEPLDGPWNDLAGADALKAYQAIRTLSAAPTAAVAWLRDRLHPAPGPDAATLAGWVAGLDSDHFEVRKQAEEELAKLGPLAHPALRRALADRPPLQVRQRIERLLAKEVTAKPLSGEELRGLRAVETLERIGTPEARQVLKKLAGGADGAGLTQEAKAACQRLAR